MHTFCYQNKHIRLYYTLIDNNGVNYLGPNVLYTSLIGMHFGSGYNLLGRIMPAYLIKSLPLCTLSQICMVVLGKESQSEIGVELYQYK